jgi:alpha-amylase
MKKILFTLLSLYGSFSLAAGTMMQAFYWDMPNGLWKTLKEQTPELAKYGITAVWIPPAYKGDSGGYSMGYDPYDLYDFGEYNQKGTVATKWGTKQELKDLVTELHKYNIQVYEDIVLNHLKGGDKVSVNNQIFYTKFDYPHKKWNRTSFDFDIFRREPVQDMCYSWGYKVTYNNPYNRDWMVKWSDYMDKEFHFDGYRFDAGMCVSDQVVRDFMRANPGKFAVEEVWDTNIPFLRSKIHNMEGRVHLFDFTLWYTLREMAYGNGYFDMRRLVNAGLVGVEPRYSVTFAENHDTGKESDKHITQNKHLMYAYILTGEGYPCVFYKDWLDPALQKELKVLIPFHNEHAHGPINILYSDEDIYAMSRDDFIFILNDNGATGKDIGDVQTPFKNAKLVNERDNITVYTDKNGYAINYKLWAPANNFSIWVVKK